MIRFETQAQLEAFMRAMREARENATGGNGERRAEVAIKAIAAIMRAKLPLERNVIDAVLERAVQPVNLSAIEEAGVAVRAAMDAGLIQKQDVDTMPPARVKALYEEIVSAVEAAMNDPKA